MCSLKKDALKNLEKFTGKHLCQSLFFNKVAGLRAATLSKKRLWHRCFPGNLAKFFKNSFFYRTPQVAVSALPEAAANQMSSFYKKCNTVLK